jgi:hypothetical protein
LTKRSGSWGRHLFDTRADGSPPQRTSGHSLCPTRIYVGLLIVPVWKLLWSSFRHQENASRHADQMCGEWFGYSLVEQSTIHK